MEGDYKGLIKKYERLLFQEHRQSHKKEESKLCLCRL